MNIIIVGCGRIGSTLVEELSGENHDISIIDEKADVVQKLAETHDVLGVIGNGASYSILLEAELRQQISLLQLRTLTN